MSIGFLINKDGMLVNLIPQERLLSLVSYYMRRHLSNLRQITFPNTKPYMTLQLHELLTIMDFY